uniref:Uncharacterized protein n=1 Tax=Oryzias sinensis TaxID=183150 RepID=A0A8C7YFW0_9TELE
LSAKQQEGRAMATLDRQIPSPDTFLHKPWSSFVSAAKLPARAQALTPQTAKHFRAGLAPFCNNIPQLPAVSLLALTAPLGSASQLKAGASMLMLASQPQGSARGPKVLL